MIVARIFTVYSSKGGVGKTFIAVNLASAIREETGRSVMLLDCNLPFSRDVASTMEIENLRSMTSLLGVADSVKADLLLNYPVTLSDGVGALGLADREHLPDFTDSSVLKKVGVLADKFSALFHYIVVDLGVEYGPVTDFIFEKSDRIVLPLECEPLSLLSAIDDLDMLMERHFSREIIHVVINRMTEHPLVTPEMVSRRLGREITAAIPLDPKMPFTMNGGKTFPSALPKHPVSRAIEQLSLQLLKGSARDVVQKQKVDRAGADGEFEVDEESVKRIKLQIHDNLLDIAELKRIDVDTGDDPEKLLELQNLVRHKAIEILDRDTSIRSRSLRERIVREVLQEALGLGPLEDLLEDESISEIMVNSAGDIYVERKGKLHKTDKTFLSNEQLLAIIERIIAPLGRRIDISSPMVDARLKDGSRVNAIIPPLSINGPALTIRKFSSDTIGIKELIAFGTLNSQISEFLQAAVKSRLNIIVSGGTGSGKTTLLNVLSAFIPSNERIITVEDSAELQLKQPHVITLEARPPNIEGKGEVTIRDLVKNTLRMRPDRIVVGECRAGEALDMLQAMNTGHDGSLTTIHANSAREAMSRLETLVMFAGFELPVKTIKEQIVGAIDIVIQLSRLKDGSRKILQVSEITGMEGDVITMGDIFTFKQEGLDSRGRIQGNFVSTGYVPRCLGIFEERGISMPREIFWTTT